MVFIGGPRQVGKNDSLRSRCPVRKHGAGHLLKYCRYVEDPEGHEMELRFIRDTDKREVDFVVLRDGRAEFAVECKSGEQSAAPACRYFRERTDIPRFYQVHLDTKDSGNATANTRVLPFSTFCREVGLP